MASAQSNITRCLFFSNSTGFGHSGGNGGDAVNSDGGNGGNSSNAGFGGAIVALTGSIATNTSITNCTLDSNRIGFSGSIGQGGASVNGFPGANGLAAPTAQGSAMTVQVPSLLTNSVSLNHCTVTGHGGATTLHMDTHTSFSLENSILSENTATHGISGDAITYVGNNIVEGSVTFTGSLSGPTPLSGPALLAPLADYGGPSHSRKPFPSSPAMNSAVPSGTSPNTDQRGAPRIGVFPDIGAVEVLQATNSSDADNDFLDDQWERLFGLSVDIDDYFSDHDQDGFTAGEEAALHTNPRDPLSRLSLTIDYLGFNLGTNMHEFEFTWPSWPLLDYDLYSHDLSAPVFFLNQTTGFPASLESSTVLSFEFLEPNAFFQLFLSNPF